MVSINGMTVALTGGAGYLGSVVSAHLLFAGARLRIVDRLLFGAASITGLLRHPSCALLVGDVRDAAFLRQAFDGVDAVVHLAAIVGESACAVEETTAFEINSHAVSTALEAADESRVGRFVFVSTCSNYGRIADEAVATEDTPLCPLSSYARAKVEAEHRVLARCRRACVLRFGTLCGLSARMRFDLLVNEMGRAAAARRGIDLFGLDAWRPLLEIGDAARAIETCLDASVEAIDGRVFNVATANVRKSDLVDLVRTHYPETPLSLGGGRADPRSYRVSVDRIRDALGYAPIGTIEQALCDVARAVALGLFRDAFSAEHSAVPSDARLLAWTRPASTSSSLIARGGLACVCP